MTVDLRDIEALEARPMAGVFTSRLASQAKAVLLAERLRWYAARLHNVHALLGDELERDSYAVGQLEASLADTQTLLAERDATIRRLNEIIRRLGGSSQ